MTEPLNKEQQRSLNDLLADGVAQKNKARVDSCLQHGGEADYVMTTRNSQGFQRKKPLAHHAYENYQADVMEALARHGMPLEAADSDGNTVLARAVQDRKTDVVKKLLELGASPLAVNNTSQTILDMARKASSNVTYNPAEFQKSEKIIDLLLEALPVVRRDFNDTAKAQGGAPLPGTTDDLVVRKPITITHKPAQKSGGKDQGGFTL